MPKIGDLKIYHENEGQYSILIYLGDGKLFMMHVRKYEQRVEMIADVEESTIRLWWSHA